MKYMCLIYGDLTADEQMTEAEQMAEIEEYGVFSQLAAEAGVMVGGEALHPPSSATTVRVRDGKVLHSDGPFAETKEYLGGYYILDCEDLDQALEFAAKIPGAKQGSIEVRPIFVFD